MVRTARLAFGNSGTSGENKVIYTCPAGVTAIAKDCRLYVDPAGGSTVIFMVQSGPRDVFLLEGQLAKGTYHVTDPWIVLEPGDQLRLVTSPGESTRYWISGTELAGVAP